MAKVSLRAYNREIESLIDQGQRLAEAIAHCHQILATYPKHLDTYRLLGKAYLEARRHDEAVDVFQRVLVASPGDFVSHVGMSIIADERGELDSAIRHMERAFEVQPSNAAVQGELQRLFRRRDGVEPPRIRLTRGALAHMYVQGQLYLQAISEIQAVLTHDPNRTDMLELLAWAHFRNGQKAETAAVCSSLLALSPYCLDANRLMAEIAPGLLAADAASDYRRRVVQLDPYAEFAGGSVLSAEAVPDDTIAVQRLEYRGDSSEVQTGPGLALASTMGAVDASDVVPDWLTSSSEVAAQGDDDVPAFLRKTAARDSAGVRTDIPREAAGPSGLASAGLSAEVPEWVRALGRLEEESPSDMDAGQDAPPSSVGTGDSAGYDLPSGPTAGTADATPDWLADQAAAPEPFQSSGEADPPRTEEQADSSAETQAGSDQSATLGQEGELPGSDESTEPSGAQDAEFFPSPSWPASTLPGLSNDLARPGADSYAEGKTGDIPKSMDWLNAVTESDVSAGADEPAGTASAPLAKDGQPPSWPESRSRKGTPLPDWLGAKVGRASESGSPTAGQPSAEFESDVALPDWLADLDTETQAISASPSAKGPAEQQPEWLPADAAGAQAGAARATNGQQTQQSAGAVQDLGSDEENLESAAPRPAAGNAPEPAQPLREPIPLGNPPVPETSPAGAPSLGGAKAELERGNLAVALEIYGKLIRKGKFLEEISRDLREALHRHPVEVSIWQALGDAYIRANRIQEALDSYTKAEELLR